MGNVNVCQAFGYDIDGGMKFFSIVEMFIAIFHLIVAYNVFVWIDAGRYSGHVLVTMIYLFYIVFLLSLIVHAIFGFLLHFLGYTKRNITICLIWTVVACVTFTMPWLILLFQFLLNLDNSNWGRISFWTSYYLYLLYLIIGVWVVISYMKWAKKTGVAVQIAVTPAPAPAPAPSEPTRNKKASNAAHAHGSVV